MSPNPYPNANYPTAWDEANMVKATDIATNETDAATGLAVTDVAGGQGPLLEQPITGADAKATSEPESTEAE